MKFVSARHRINYHEQTVACTSLQNRRLEKEKKKNLQNCTANKMVAQDREELLHRKKDELGTNNQSILYFKSLEAFILITTVSQRSINNIETTESHHRRPITRF